MSTTDNFYKVFLSEMPMRVPGSNAFNSQLGALRDNLQSGVDAILVSSNTFKIETDADATYWVGDAIADEVLLIVNTRTSGNFCKVELTSKNPAVPPGTPPHASDLYLIIKSDVKNHNLVFSSGDMLSDDGIKLWKGITTRGGKVSVYDKSTAQYVLSPVSDAEELSQFIGGNHHMKYIFVLSENLGQQRGVITSIAIIEMKRMANWPLFEHLIKGAV